MNSTYALILGLLLRIGIPLVISGVLFFFLKRLDERWQKQARILPLVPAGKRCWEINGCAPSKKKQCPAFAQPNLPCWQVFRGKDGTLKETCLGCAVFRQSPSPVRA